MDTAPWTVVLICGAAGVGKTRVATALAARHGVPVSQVDDVVVALTALSTPESHPLLHYWDTHPEAWSWPAGRIAELHLRTAGSLAAGLRAVIADRLDGASRVVLEGDYLTPELTVGFDHRVRTVVLAETDPEAIAANFLSREPGDGSQHHRAQVSVAVGAALAEHGHRLGVPVLPVRPWAGNVDRVDEALSERT